MLIPAVAHLRGGPQKARESQAVGGSSQVQQYYNRSNEQAIQNLWNMKENISF